MLVLAPLASPAQVIAPLIRNDIASQPSARQQQAEALAGQAGGRWQYWPTPSLSVENARVSAADSVYRGDATVSVLPLQPSLWNGGWLATGVERDEAGVGASQAALDEARQQLALRVVQAHGDWLGP